MVQEKRWTMVCLICMITQVIQWERISLLQILLFSLHLFSGETKSTLFLRISPCQLSNLRELSRVFLYLKYIWVWNKNSKRLSYNNSSLIHIIEGFTQSRMALPSLIFEVKLHREWRITWRLTPQYKCNRWKWFHLIVRFRRLPRCNRMEIK